MSRLAHRLARHFARYRTLSKWPFFWRISLEGMLVPLLLVIVAGYFHPMPNRNPGAGVSFWQMITAMVIASPFIETVLLQALPVMIARALGCRFWVQVLASLVVFAAAHLVVDLANTLFGGIISGFYITFTYVHWRKNSFRAALWMTAGTHGLHNLATLLLAAAMGDLH